MTWDTMMEHYQPGRRALLEAAWAEAERILGRPPRSVLDLGGGPGTTLEATLARWPAARAALLDVDPVLLALARAALPSSAEVSRTDLGRPGWVAAAGDRYEAVLAVMTLHYLPPARVRQLYSEIRDVLVAGGLLLVIEPMRELPVRSKAEQRRATELRQPENRWAQWWQDLADDVAWRSLLSERRTAPQQQSADFVASVEWHQDAARAAGYARCWPMLRSGDHVLLGSLAPGGPADAPR